MDTGAGNFSTPDITHLCSGSRPIAANAIPYPLTLEPLFFIAIGQNLVDFNNNDAARFALTLDTAINSFKTNRPAYQTLTAQQQNLRLVALDLAILLRDIARQHPLCVVHFYP